MYITNVQSTSESYSLSSTSSTRKQVNEPMFEYRAGVNRVEQHYTTQRLRNPNDKRRDCAEYQWNWINGLYNNVKQGTLKEGFNKVSFVGLIDTEDGFEEYNITIEKRDNGTTRITEDRFGQGNEVTRLEIDNLSGKIISQQSKNGDGSWGVKRIYKEDGTVERETENSLVNKLKKKYIDVPDIHY